MYNSLTNKDTEWSFTTTKFCPIYLSLHLWKTSITARSASGKLYMNISGILVLSCEANNFAIYKKKFFRKKIHLLFVFWSAYPKKGWWVLLSFIEIHSPLLQNEKKITEYMWECPIFVVDIECSLSRRKEEMESLGGTYFHWTERSNYETHWSDGQWWPQFCLFCPKEFQRYTCLNCCIKDCVEVIACLDWRRNRSQKHYLFLHFCRMWACT